MTGHSGNYKNVTQSDNELQCTTQICSFRLYIR